MIVYTDEGRGRPVELGEAVGHGGEATVYRLATQPGWLAKIYDPEPRPNYDLKLGWMVEHPPENPTSAFNHASLAWPDALFYDAKGRLKGYRMPYIDHGLPLLDVFNPRRRAEALPLFDRRYLHRTARNLAAALSALHHSGYVAGDINESNILVTPQALVTIIDTDSFQVRKQRAKGEILYPCPVGKPEYTPPELQGKSLATITREEEHDAFGLAALIFQLLMEGSHPFRAQWLGQGDPPPLEKRIAQGAYPYEAAPGKLVAPPKSAPDQNTLHPHLMEMFRTCFVDGHANPSLRPSPDLWARTIAEAETSLVCCAHGHFYASHLATCPYCARPKNSGPVRPVSTIPSNERPRPNWRTVPRAASSRASAASPASGKAAPASARPVAASGTPKTVATAASATAASAPVRSATTAAPGAKASAGAPSWQNRARKTSTRPAAATSASAGPASAGSTSAGPTASTSQQSASQQSTGWHSPGRPTTGWQSSARPASAAPGQGGFSGAPSWRMRVQPIASSPFVRKAVTGAVARLFGWQGTMAPAGAPINFGSQGSSSIGALSSQPWMQPASIRAWLGQWLGKSFLVGGGLGALAGAIPAALIAVFSWSAGSPLNWDLLVVSSGIAGGLLRGWQPGYRFANVVDRYVGLKRFWQVIGLLVGAAVGSAFGMICAWAIFPLIIGLVLGAQGGAYLGGRFWQAGKTVGWEKILGITGALGAAALGWGAAKFSAASGLSSLGAQLADRLLPLAGDGLVESGLLWLAAGGLCGAVFGALAGLLVDLVARLLRLTD